MKKLLLLICALLGLGASGAWATDVIISDQSNLSTINSTNYSTTAVHKYGTYSAPAGGTTFTTNSNSGLSGVTITSTSNIVKSFYYSGDAYKYGLAFKPTDGETYTITISAPENYVIIGYTMKAISTSQNQKFEVIASSGTYEVTSSQNYITGRVANQQSTTFTLRNKLNDGNAAAQELCLPFFTITLLPSNDASVTKISDVSDLSKSKTYLIHSIDYSPSDLSRGYLSGTSGYLASTAKTGNWSPNSFAIIQYEDKYFLYDVFNKKFVRTENYSSNAAEVKGIETNTSILPVTIEKRSDGIFKIKMGVNYMNFSGSYTYGITINYYSDNDAGNNLELIESSSFDDTEAITTLEAYLANPSIVNGGKYKIKLNGTNFYISKDASGNAKTETTASELILSENGTNAAGKKAYSIKDAGTNKYLSYTDITYSGGENSRLSWADTDTNSKFVFTQGSGTYSTNILIRPADACDDNYVTSWNNNYADKIFVFWTLSNAMSYWTLEKITKNVTYNLKWNGSTINTNSSVSAHVGGSADDFIPWDVPSYSSFTCDVSTIGEATTEVNVTMNWNGPFEFSSDFASAKWYYLKLHNKYVYFDTEAPNTLLFSNDKVEEPKALWAFFGNPYNGVKIANLYVGDDLFIRNDLPAVMDASSFVTNHIGSNDYGFTFYEDGYYLADAGGGVNSTNASGAAQSSSAAMNVEPYVVTYNLKFGSSTIATKTLDKVTGDSKDLFPSEWARDFCTYSYEPAEIGNSTTSVDVTMTWNGPFDISADYENAVWYYLAVNGKWGKNSSSGYLNAPDIFSDIADVRGADDGQWAFFGNPYDGFLLSLKEKYMSTIQVYLSSQLAAPAFGNATGSTEKWTVNRLSGSTFTLNCGDKYIVDNSETMGFKTTALEGSEGTFSVRSYYCQQALDDLADYAEENAVGHYFGVRQNGVDNVQAWILSVPTLTSSDYSTYFSEFPNNIPNELKNGLSTYYPASGKFYRIKNNSTGNYLAYGTPTTSEGGNRPVGLIATSTSNDAASVIKLTGSAGTYKISTQGLNIQGQSNANVAFPGSGEDGVDFVFNIATPGVVSITNAASSVNENNDGSLHEATVGWGVHGVVNWKASDANSKWVVEDAESITIPLTPATDNEGTHTYATLCVPFNITGLTGANSKEVKAYAPTKSGDYIVPGEGATTIAAGTPVILIGEDGDATSVTANIGLTYAASPVTSDVVLTGTFAGTSIDCTAATGTNYVLGFDKDNGNRIGFYHVDNTSFGLKANRAYLKLDGSGNPTHVKGFAINFGEIADGIKAMDNTPVVHDGPIFNLAGQRISKLQRGVNIVKGKKVVVK